MVSRPPRMRWPARFTEVKPAGRTGGWDPRNGVGERAVRQVRLVRVAQLLERAPARGFPLLHRDEPEGSAICPRAGSSLLVGRVRPSTARSAGSLGTRRLPGKPGRIGREFGPEGRETSARLLLRRADIQTASSKLLGRAERQQNGNDEGSEDPLPSDYPLELGSKRP